MRQAAVVVALYFVAGFTLLFFESGSCLPPRLERGLHDDYPRHLRWIPRRATSWRMVQPPTMVLGNQSNYYAAKDGRSGPRAVPAPGEWQISFVQIRAGWPFFLPYAAVTLGNNWHARLGCRWDELDSYYSCPSVTVKKIR